MPPQCQVPAANGCVGQQLCRHDVLDLRPCDISEQALGDLAAQPVLIQACERLRHSRQAPLSLGDIA